MTYIPSGKPLPGTRGSDAEVRSEFQAIGAAFALLPASTSVVGGFANYGIDTGASNVYFVTMGSSVAAYADGLTILFSANSANTGPSTLNINGIGPRALVRADGTPLLAGDLVISQIIQVSYSMVQGKFQINASGAAAQALAAANSATSAASSATAAAASAAQAASSASSAALSATAAAGYGAALTGTSGTSALIAVGVKNFTTTTGRQWSAGQFLNISSGANNLNLMHGQVVSYDQVLGALSMNITDIGGSGTFSDWQITVSGTQGTTGSTGIQGPAGTALLFTTVSDVAASTTMVANGFYNVIGTGVALTFPSAPATGTPVGFNFIAAATGGSVDPLTLKIQNSLGVKTVTPPFTGTFIYTGTGQGWVRL